MNLKHASNRPRPAQRGFTLIELMITVAVVALLASIALPSFMDSVRKGRRSEAFAALSAVQQAQERWRGNHGSYAGNAQLAKEWNDAEDPGLGLSATTQSGYYGIAIAAESATGYVVTAVAAAGTSQAADTQCAKLGVQMDGGNLSYAGAPAAGDLNYAATHPCWSK